jgi:hypothetical protein
MELPANTHHPKSKEALLRKSLPTPCTHRAVLGPHLERLNADPGAQLSIPRFRQHHDNTG